MTADSHAAHVARNLARLQEHLGGDVVALLADATLISLSANPDDLPWRGARIQVVLPPIVSAPSFTIEMLATETDAS